MASIYQRALGSDFAQLHPQIQRRFSLSSESGLAAIGTGVMQRIWRGGIHTLPLLYMGARRNILFPEQRDDVHFNLQNYAYRDSLGRETVTWIRKFATTKVRRFDAYMVYSEERDCLVLSLGSQQDIVVDLEARVDEAGGLAFQSGKQRIYGGSLRSPLPRLFSGSVSFREWFDDGEQCFRVKLTAANALWGKLFGYEGRFRVEWETVPLNYVPDSIKPRRTRA